MYTGGAGKLSQNRSSLPEQQLSPEILEMIRALWHIPQATSAHTFDQRLFVSGDISLSSLILWSKWTRAGTNPPAPLRWLA